MRLRELACAIPLIAAVASGAAAQTVLVEEEMTALSRTLIGRDAEPNGTVVITMPHALALTSIMDDMARFSDAYPSIDLKIHFSNDVADLARREADVSLRVAHSVDDDVVGRKLVPWLMKYLSNANDGDTRRIARALTHIALNM